MILVPAIDLMGGRAVTLVGGNPDEAAAPPSDPLSAYGRWRAAGAKRIHVVDLDAALSRGDNRPILKRLLAERGAEVQVGGGVRSLDAIRWCIQEGASRVIVGTRGIRDPQWLEEASRAYPDRILLSVDTRRGRVASEGWTATTNDDALSVIRQANALPLAGFIYTSIDVEGQLRGLDRPAVERVASAARRPLQVAGGVTTHDDLRFLKRLGVDGAILGAALYTGRLVWNEARQALSEDGP